MKAKIGIIVALVVLGVVIFFAGYYVGTQITTSYAEQSVKNAINQMAPYFQQCRDNNQTLADLNANYTCKLK
jgi:hypothetical protein